MIGKNIFEEDQRSISEFGRSEITPRPERATRIGKCQSEDGCTEYFVDVKNDLNDLIVASNVYKNHAHHCKIWTGTWSDSGCSSSDKKNWVCFRDKRFSGSLESYSQTWRVAPTVGKRWCLAGETQYPSDLAWASDQKPKAKYSLEDATKLKPIEADSHLSKRLGECEKKYRWGFRLKIAGDRDCANQGTAISHETTMVGSMASIDECNAKLEKLSNEQRDKCYIGCGKYHSGETIKADIFTVPFSVNMEAGHVVRFETLDGCRKATSKPFSIEYSYGTLLRSKLGPIVIYPQGSNQPIKIYGECLKQEEVFCSKGQLVNGIWSTIYQ